MPGGGLSPDGERWVRCRPGFFLPVRVLSRLFRRRFLEELAAAHQRGQLRFFGDDAALAEAQEFAQWLAPLRACEWVVYAKRPFAGPAAVLAYLSRYTHRVAISNSRLLAFNQRGVTFRWQDYRTTGKTRYKAMTLAADEFMRRFLLHVLPAAFTASVTTGCSPMPVAASIWLKHANFCTSSPPRRNHRCRKQCRSPSSPRLSSVRTAAQP